jgi:hypothetical protein
MTDEAGPPLRKLVRIKPKLQRYFAIDGLSGSLNTRHSYPGGANGTKGISFRHRHSDRIGRG